MKITKCNLFGHKITWMRISAKSRGFACWRCGLRFGWGGERDFSPLFLEQLQDGRRVKEYLSVEALREANAIPLKKTGHWHTAIAEDSATLTVTLTPIEEPKWAKRR